MPNIAEVQAGLNSQIDAGEVGIEFRLLPSTHRLLEAKHALVPDIEVQRYFVPEPEANTAGYIISRQPLRVLCPAFQLVSTVIFNRGLGIETVDAAADLSVWPEGIPLGLKPDAEVSVYGIIDGIESGGAVISNIDGLGFLAEEVSTHGPQESDHAGFKRHDDAFSGGRESV